MHPQGHPCTLKAAAGSPLGTWRVTPWSPLRGLPRPPGMASQPLASAQPLTGAISDQAGNRFLSPF